MRSYSSRKINCAKCGHPYLYQPIEKDDPYSPCMYCGFLLEKNTLEVQIIGSVYAQKVCNNNKRQERERQIQKNS